MSDTTAVTLGATTYVIGGYTTTPLRSVLAFRPGTAAGGRRPAPPRALRGGGGGRRADLVAGGTTGTPARREILSVDPAAHRTRVLGRLPVPLAHAAGATLGGISTSSAAVATRSRPARDDLGDRPRDPRVRRAGRLPCAVGPRRGHHGPGSRRRRPRRAAGAHEAVELAPDEAVGAPSPGSTLAALAGCGVLVAGWRIAAQPRRRRPERLHDRRAAVAVARAPPRRAARAAPPDVYAAAPPAAWRRPAASPRACTCRTRSPTPSTSSISARDGRPPLRRRRLPQHVTPSWDLRTLWVTNDKGNSLTPIDPRTGRPARPSP